MTRIRTKTLTFGDIRVEDYVIISRHDLNFEFYHRLKSNLGHQDYDLLVKVVNSVSRYNRLEPGIYAVKAVDVDGYPTIDNQSPAVLVLPATPD